MEVKTKAQIKLEEKYPLAFLAFYNAYPKSRHQGYVLPYKRWKVLEKNGVLPEISVILSAIEIQKKTRSWIEGYVPMMSTWLTQQRWEAAIVDNDIKVEAHKVASQSKKDTFFAEQREVHSEEVSVNKRYIDRVVYNTRKFLPDVDAEHLERIISFFVYNGVPIYVEDGSNMVFAVEFSIVDAINDLMALRAKGILYTDVFLNETVRDFTNTIIFIILARHCDAQGIAHVGKLVLSEKESIVLRKLLSVLTDATLCTGYREKYGVQPRLSVDSWFLAFNYSTILDCHHSVI